MEKQKMKVQTRNRGRQKGTPKTGGRVAGTPNKVSSKVRSILAEITDEYYSSQQFKQDLAELEPKDRIQAIEKFTSYIAPKLQSTTLDIASETKTTIEDKLIAMSMSVVEL